MLQDLRAEAAVGRSSQFRRTFLSELEENPDEDVADTWDRVEQHFAELNKVPPRQNPYREVPESH